MDKFSMHDVGSLIRTRGDLKALLYFVSSRIKRLLEEGMLGNSGVHDPIESPKLNKLYHQLEVLAHECD